MNKFIIIAILFLGIQMMNAQYPDLSKLQMSHTPLRDLGEPLILTPYLEEGKIAEALKASEVNATNFLNVKSYSGYFTVDSAKNSNLFFWFFPSANNPATDPVILWLQGGPGAPSLYGLFEENGPFVVLNEKLSLRGSSWHNTYSIVYIDQPIGTGYSFTDGTPLTNQVEIGDQLYKGLTQFFTLFSDYKSLPFYIAGESYAGKYVPAIGYTIHQRNPTASAKINLQGLLIGNGLTDPINQIVYSDFLYELGLIDHNTKESYQQIEEVIRSLINLEEYQLATTMLGKVTGNLFQESTHLPNIYDYLSDLEFELSGEWASYVVSDQVRQELHVGSRTFTIRDESVYQALYEDITKSVAEWVSELLSHYRVLIYNGQMDALIAYVFTENYLKQLNFSASIEYATAERNIWSVNGKVAGYAKLAGNLTEVLVRDAGHMVPRDQPLVTLDLIKRFIQNEPFN